MMGYGGYGWGGGWMMPFGGLIWFVVLILLAVWVVWLLRSPPAGHRIETRSRGLDVLEERYARGEIERDEYLQKKRDLTDRS